MNLWSNPPRLRGIMRTRPRGLPRRRVTGYGYAAIPILPIRTIRGCASPIDPFGRLVVTYDWAIQCFLPAYQQAVAIWGPNAPAIADDIVTRLVPTIQLGPATTGAQRELVRRVDEAVATLLNAAGAPTPYPSPPIGPRPVSMPAAPAWALALMTGWPR